MKRLLLSVFVLSFVLMSCDITDMNEDTKGATNVAADPLFTSGQFNLGDYLHNTSVNLNNFKFMAQYFSATDYPAESRYAFADRGVSSNIWSTLYRGILANLQESKEKIKANDLIGEGEKANKIASIEVLNVMTYHYMVTLWGDIPYLNAEGEGEALDPDDNSQPTYKDAEEIYMDLMERLDNAIAMFDPSADSFGEADNFYQGDVGKWIKFANSLKLRMGIMLADSNPDIAQTAVEEAAPNAFKSNGDNAIIPFDSNPPNTNPLWEAIVQSGRDDYIPSDVLVDKMNELNDPRRPVFYDKKDGEYIGGPYGEQNAYADFSHLSSLMEESGRPGVIMGYDEVELILAEAVERGYAVTGSAADHYEKAIRADMEYWKNLVGDPEIINEDDIDAYLAQDEVAYATAPGNWKQKIGNQMWLALFLQGTQGWNVFRRLGYPDLQAPTDAVSAAKGEVPVRFRYPIDEQNYNEQNYNNASEAIGGDEFTNNLFWDVD